ncbi:MAG: S9 family peptidase [Prevotellaceae bacterium]|nr:S9 family peptidase [Prevotellaceae bacterium]
MRKFTIISLLLLAFTQARAANDTIFSPDKKTFLVERNHTRIYRRSFTSQYFFNGDTNKPLTNRGVQECVKFSPDGRNIAFIHDNNIYIREADGSNETQVTFDGEINRILNGKPDWVYEEEFGLKNTYEFSPDGNTIVWVRFDESKVKTFSFPLYQGTNPTYKDYAIYPNNYEYKYPKAGEDNSKVSVWAYDINTKKTLQLNVPLDADGYIPRIAFTEHNDKVGVVTLNRNQNKMSVFICNCTTGQAECILTLNAKEYFDESAYSDFSFKNDCFTMLDDRDGYNHLYLYNIKGQLVRQITKGNFDVADYFGYDERQKCYYYSSHEVSPLDLNIYKIDAKGRKTCLTPEKGWHEATFSADFTTFTDEYSTILQKPVTRTISNKGKILSVSGKAEPTEPSDSIKIELFTFTTSEGVELNGWMVRPLTSPNCGETEGRNPVIMYQYSGPGSQEVKNSWKVGFKNGLEWEREWAKKGYVVVCVDGRGTGSRGAAFKKCTYLTLGEKEAKDQVEAAIWLSRQPYVDKDRIAIWGWSFGGFNTLLSMSEGRHVFRCGVAVAPVTDWRFYDTVYTERFLRTPQENPKGYDCGPLHSTDKLHGDLLIMHGLADDNVHFQNTAEYIEKLVQRNVQFESQFYTNRNHSIYGGNTRDHLKHRLENFLDKHLLK